MFMESKSACAFAPSIVPSKQNYFVETTTALKCGQFFGSGGWPGTEKVSTVQSTTPFWTKHTKRKAKRTSCCVQQLESHTWSERFSAPNKLSAGSVAIVWLRNDLRIRDHPSFMLASTADLIAPIYVFDLTKYGHRNKSPWGFQRCGPFQAEFLVNSVTDVTKKLRAKACDIYIRQGNPVEEVLSLAQDLVSRLGKPVTILAQKETTWEEVRNERRIERGVRNLSEDLGISINIHWLWTNSLHHPADLPFDVTGSQLPPTLGDYQEMVFPDEGARVPVRDVIEAPERLPRFPLSLKLRRDAMPSLGTDLGIEGLCDPHDHAFPNPLAAYEFIGGTDEADDRIEEYIRIGDHYEIYSDQHELSGRRNTSTKLSPWLSLGCLSPREIYWILQDMEKKSGASQSVRDIIQQLITRDYFRWVSLLYKGKLFALNGFTDSEISKVPIWKLKIGQVKKGDRELLQKWIDGMTGAPYVDAAMRELKNTGFMSNRSRRNVASFLIHDLKFPDWRAGAEYFESKLIDYDAASNWGNWAFLAGMGTDPSAGARMNVIEESMVYDGDSFFITRWCPELLFVPPAKIHQPHLLSDDERKSYDILEGYYPEPVVPLPDATEELVEPLKELEGIVRDPEWVERIRNDFIEAGAEEVTRLT